MFFVLFLFLQTVNLILLIVAKWNSAFVSFGMQYLFLQYVKVYSERVTTPTSCRQAATHVYVSIFSDHRSVRMVSVNQLKSFDAKQHLLSVKICRQNSIDRFIREICMLQ